MDKELDFEERWRRLRNEMIHLKEEQVQVLYPAIVLSFMGYIDQQGEIASWGTGTYQEAE